MNKGVVIWILCILLFISGTIPVTIDVYEKVSQKVPHDKVVQSIDLVFENVTTTQLVSRATPYNARGYRTYGPDNYTLYKEINVSVPYFRYGFGKPKEPQPADLKEGKWKFTFNSDNCTTSFRLYNPNYVPIEVLVNFTVIQENKKFWEGLRHLPFTQNATIEARQYTKALAQENLREASLDEDDLEQYFGRGFCRIDPDSFVFTFQNSSFIRIATEKDYERLEHGGERFYEFNYVGTRYMLEKENVTITEQIPHTVIVNKTVIEYRTIDRIVKREARMPLYFALFALAQSVAVKKEGLNTH